MQKVDKPLHLIQRKLEGKGFRPDKFDPVFTLAQDALRTALPFWRRDKEPLHSSRKSRTNSTMMGACQMEGTGLQS